MNPQQRNRQTSLARLTMRVRALEASGDLRQQTGTPEAPASRLEVAETLLDQAEDAGLPVAERIRKLHRARALLQAEAEQGALP